MSTPTLLLPRDYVKTATQHINNAQYSVSFICMMMTDDLSTSDLIDALSNAAKRGVDVRVAADVFTYGEFGGHFLPFKYYSKQSRATTEMAKQLTRSGVKFTWLGRFSTLPFTGRTHSKCLIVDDTVYSFGGVNLDDRSLSYIDYMFRCEDIELAGKLSDDIGRLIEADGHNFAYRSHEFPYDNNTVLMDGGFQGDSIIYRRACKYAKEASKVLFVSQYCPSGKLGKLLKKTDTSLYFNPPELASFWNRMIIRFGMFTSRNRTLYKRKTYIHAKFIIFTMPDGKKVAITGSHNFAPAGVVMGTREIAIETSDPKIISQLENFYEQYIK